MAFKNWCNKLICIITSGNFCYVLYRPYDLKKENEPNLFKKWKTKLNGNNFSKYSLIFAFSTILAGNKYIFTYLIRISIKIVQNKYTYWKKVSRRNPVYWSRDHKVCCSTLHCIVLHTAGCWYLPGPSIAAISPSWHPSAAWLLGWGATPLQTPDIQLFSSKYNAMIFSSKYNYSVQSVWMLW